MKKSLLWITVLVISISMMITFSSVGCKAPEKEVEPAGEEVEEVEEVEPAEEEVAEEEFNVVIMLPHLVSPYYTTVINAAEKAAEKYPSIKVEIKTPTAEPGLEDQIAMLEDVLQKDIDLIGFSSINWDAVKSLLQQARDKGVEIALMDVSEHIEGIDALTVVGCSNVEGGREAGKYVAELLDEKGRIAILEGVTGDYWSEGRIRGFREIIDEYPEIEIATIQPAKWAREEALAVMENILQTLQDLDLVWGLNGNMALGAIKAIQDAGLQDQIIVVGYNGDKEECEAIKAGIEKATIGQNPVGVGKTLIEEISVKLLEGKRDEIPHVIPVPVILVTKENVEDYEKIYE